MEDLLAKPGFYIRFNKLFSLPSKEMAQAPLAPVRVNCGFTGFPSPAEDYEERTINISEVLGIKKNKTWIFKAEGNSLKDIGILDGDYLVVDSSLTPQIGHLCICIVEGEFMAKFVELIKEVPYLVSANDQVPPVKINKDDAFQVFGVVTGRFAGQFTGIKRK